MPTVGQGGTIRLDATFQDGAGNLVVPITPLVDILNPSNVQVVVGAIPINDGVGRYYYNYVVSVTAPLGTWKAHWTGVINSVPVSGDDYFTVVIAGSIDFGSTYYGPAASDKDLVRFLIGDTDLNDVQLSNSDLYYLLAKWKTPAKAAWKAAQARAAFFAHKANVTVGSISVLNGQKYQQWTELASRLRNDMLTGVAAAPWAASAALVQSAHGIREGE